MLEEIIETQVDLFKQKFDKKLDDIGYEEKERELLSLKMKLQTAVKNLENPYKSTIMQKIFNKPEYIAEKEERRKLKEQVKKLEKEIKNLEEEIEVALDQSTDIEDLRNIEVYKFEQNIRKNMQKYINKIVQDNPKLLKNAEFLEDCVYENITTITINNISYNVQEFFEKAKTQPTQTKTKDTIIEEEYVIDSELSF